MEAAKPGSTPPATDGTAQWSNTEAFQADVADFALFAAFIVVAGAIECFLEPLASVIPPWGNGATEKADRPLLLTSIALLIDLISSIEKKKEAAGALTVGG